MKLYITYGTVEYLKRLVKANTDKKMRLMVNSNTAVLFHETVENSIFNEPKTYDVLDSIGDISSGSYAVLNNIPVSYEGRPLFEKKFSDRARLIENVPGFSAIRVLRPQKSDTYIILTIWVNEQSFKDWQQSQAFETAHKNNNTKVDMDKTKIYPRPSYVTRYYSVEDKE